MSRHAEAILEKMRSSNYQDLSFDFAFKLTNESERGAILVGSSKVETYIESLILKIFPLKQKNYTTRLLNYPGPLSSFSGKIELCFAFRFIDERLYNSLTSLRKIRNDAAHSNEVFSLKDMNGKIERIYDFEEGFPDVINKLASNNLLTWVKNNAKQALIDNDLGQLDFEKIWNERYPTPEKDDAFLENLRIWKLAYGLTFLCLKIEVIQDELNFSKKKNE